MPFFYVIDNEFVVFFLDYRMTIYRNDLPVMTEYGKDQLFNGYTSLNGNDLIFDGKKHHARSGFKAELLEK